VDLVNLIQGLSVRHDITLLSFMETDDENRMPIT
jgi:hypothetical protein